MEKAIKFCRLDFLMIKSYIIKNVALLSLMGIGMSIVNKNTIMIISMIGVYGVIILSYTFVIEEKNHMDNFYGSLSIKRKSIVAGRYMFNFLSGLCLSVFSCMSAIIINKIMRFDMSNMETMVSSAAVFASYILIISIQMPIYFKLGYSKAKMIANLPMFIIVFGAPAAIAIFDSNSLTMELQSTLLKVESNPEIYAIPIAAVIVFIFFISYLLSVKLYEGRKE